MRIAALVKQVPTSEELELDSEGRLRRHGTALEMNAYCRRAVAQAVAIAATSSAASVTVFTMGPPSAEDVLREAIAWGQQSDVVIDAVHITDPAFAGSDTLATARTLATALKRDGPFDLILLGRNSLDADTGQVAPQLAELLGLPFAGGVRHLVAGQSTLDLRCEHDDGWVEISVETPVVLSAAERLIEPCKVPAAQRAEVRPELIRRLGAEELGAGPWGSAASPTFVGEIRTHVVTRERLVLAGQPHVQARRAVDLLAERGAFEQPSGVDSASGTVTSPRGQIGQAVAVLIEPNRGRLTREMLGTAALLATASGGHVVALTQEVMDAVLLGSWGADIAISLPGELVEEDVAQIVARWASSERPWAIIAPSTMWGREVAARAAASLGAGLTGDAVALDVEGNRLIGWKPVFGGQCLAAISASSEIQMATVRAGVLPTFTPRRGRAEARSIAAPSRTRVRVRSRTREDDLEVLAESPVVVGVGRGVRPHDYPALTPLLDLLGAELGATRKVTDNGWLPRTRQIGITGCSISPRLYIAVGTSGKYNHMVGARSAGTVLAVNTDRDALVYDAADIGIVADWRIVVPHLVAELERRKVAEAPPGFDRDEGSDRTVAM